MIVVTVTADDTYLPHVAAMLHSATVVRGQAPLEVHLLQPEGVDVQSGPLAAMLAGSGGSLVVHRIDGHRLSDISSERFSITAWYRVLVPELLPDHDRVIHLDGDMLVDAMLQDLWTIDLAGSPFAAVENPLYPWMPPASSRLGLGDCTPYLNSGVLLMDLQEMRRCGAVDRLLDHGRTHPENPWPEQDALSTVFAGRWLDLHPRWNVQSTVMELPTRHLPWARELVVDARRKPSIRHFSGPLKPWDGWASRAVLEAYVEHRRGAGYPMQVPPRAKRSAALLHRLPMKLRRRALLRVLHSRKAS